MPSRSNIQLDLPEWVSQLGLMNFMVAAREMVDVHHRVVAGKLITASRCRDYFYDLL